MTRSPAMITCVVIAACLFRAAPGAQAGFSPARYGSGATPSLPALTEAVGGGQAIFELVISPAGAVTTVTPLRTTPPFTELVARAIGGWQFTPAEDEAIGPDGKPAGRAPVPSKVLVAAIYRAPTLQTPTLGERPRNVASASTNVPFPSSTAEPPYPVQARSGGVVVIEALVDSTGQVADARVIGSAPPFDSAALDAARQWRFRPAREGGKVIASYVYLVFGFPQPVTG
jgi:protein TonB